MPEPEVLRERLSTAARVGEAFGGDENVHNRVPAVCSLPLF